MEKSAKLMVAKTLQVFPKSFINQDDELILEPKNNVYFRLEGLKTETDFICKLMAWTSRPIAKGLTPSWSKKVLARVNELLGTNFSKEDMQVIYTHLGGDVNPALSVKFIESGYDLSVLQFRKATEGA